MVQIAIIGNGEPFERPSHIDGYDYVIAADGGASLCIEWGITPSHCVGDGDSLDPALPDALPTTEFSITPEQATTDLEKAIGLTHGLISTTNAYIDLFAVTSHDRLDHTLTALQCMVNNPAVRALYTPHQIIEYVTVEKKMHQAKGTLFSLLPQNLTARVHISGCRWSGENIVLDTNRSGVSNAIVSDNASIQIISGAIFYIIKKQTSSHETDFSLS